MGPHRFGWAIVTSRYCKLQWFVAAAVAFGSLGRVIRLGSSWICSLANPPRAGREQRPSLSSAFRENLAACDEFSRAVCPIATRRSTLRARFACRNHHGPLERSDPGRPLTWAGNMLPAETVSPTGRLRKDEDRSDIFLRFSTFYFRASCLLNLLFCASTRSRRAPLPFAAGAPPAHETGSDPRG
jgi:hypothetical protein